MCVSGAVLWLVVRSFVISELVRHPSSAHKNIFSSIRALIEITIYVHTYVHTDTHPCIHTHTHVHTNVISIQWRRFDVFVCLEGNYIPNPVEVRKKYKAMTIRNITCIPNVLLHF